MEKKVIYYSDELNDEFANDNIVPKTIDENYQYIHNSLWKKFTHFFWYRCIAIPLGRLYLFLCYRHKIVNQNVLKDYQKKAYFVYANHTHQIADSLIPSMINIKNDTYVIVHPNNVSIPYLGKITPSLGALPLPDNLKASKNFIKAIEYRINQNHPIMIYPEAHIWPYYTKIRPFVNTSFRYPIKYDLPVFCFTNTYQKRKNKVKIVTYVDGPFFADKTKSIEEQRQQLRDLVYSKMVERSKNNNVEIIKYERNTTHD